MADKVQKIREEIEKIKTAHSSVGLKESNPDVLVVQVCTNLLSFIDSLQEEPHQELYNKLSNLRDSAFLNTTKESWEACLSEEPVSEELEKAAKNFSNNLDNIYGSIGEQTRNAFKAGAEWGKEQAEIQIKAQSIALAHGCPKEESVSEGLEEAAENYAATDEVLPNGKVMINFQVEKAFRVGANWQKANLWKPANGDDLPEYNREVIVLLYNGKVVFAHRPPEYWYGKNIITGKVTRNYPKTYDKGGWNIPNVKYWLDYDINELLCIEK